MDANGNTKLFALLGLFVLLSFLDAAITSILLTKVGTDIEMNPLAVNVYKMGGVPGLFVFKTVTVLTVVCLIKKCERFSIPVCMIGCLITFIAVSFGVYCLWNI